MILGLGAQKPDYARLLELAGLPGPHQTKRAQKIVMLHTLGDPSRALKHVVYLRLGSFCKQGIPIILSSG